MIGLILVGLSSFYLGLALTDHSNNIWVIVSRGLVITNGLLFGAYNICGVL